MGFTRFLFSLFLLFFSAHPAVALQSDEGKISVVIDQAVPRAGARVGVGSPLTLRLPGFQSAHSGLFLGQMIKVDGKLDQMILLDSELQKVLFVDRGKVDLNRNSLQKILRPYPQIDGTCTGYALHHLFAQIGTTGVAGNAQLAATFSTEFGRTQFLVRAINDYYLATRRRNSILGIMKGYGKEFGLRCQKKIFDDAVSAIRHVQEKTSRGIPILISFFIGPNMVDSPYSLQNFSDDFNANDPRQFLDGRLWIPRKIGERESGGHSVVAVGSFESGGRSQFLMLDSDWSEPRVWDASGYLGGKVDLKNLEFYSCDGAE
ncbi:MAG: hypothetical protein KGP28_02305 [Bdellovibrionales bacterium]|nr:hypothetical protein [Bdellovibrionales bacterium]